MSDKRVFLRPTLCCILALLAVACGEAELEPTSSPSPLIGADSDRLWMLARASKVGDGRRCKELYLNPEDPRYQALTQSCDFWSRDYADYLRLNGFPTVEHLHLQDPAYWRWYLGTRQAISNCLTQLGNLPVTATGDDRALHDARRHACDPYDDALKNKNQTPTDLKIRHN